MGDRPAKETDVGDGQETDEGPPRRPVGRHGRRRRRVGVRVRGLVEPAAGDLPPPGRAGLTGPLEH